MHTAAEKHHIDIMLALALKSRSLHKYRVSSFIHIIPTLGKPFASDIYTATGQDMGVSYWLDPQANGQWIYIGDIMYSITN